MRRPWEAIRAAMQEELSDLSWTELFFGTAFLAAGSRGPGTLGARPQGAAFNDRGNVRRGFATPSRLALPVLRLPLLLEGNC